MSRGWIRNRPSRGQGVTDLRTSFGADEYKDTKIMSEKHSKPKLLQREKIIPNNYREAATKKIPNNSNTFQ